MVLTKSLCIPELCTVSVDVSIVLKLMFFIWNKAWSRRLWIYGDMWGLIHLSYTIQESNLYFYIL